MLKYLLIFLFLPASVCFSQAATNVSPYQKYFFTDDEGSYYLDTLSPVKNDNDVEVRIKKVNEKKGIKISDNTYELISIKLYCISKEYDILKETLYEEAGVLSIAIMQDGTHRKIKGNTYVDALFNIVCENSKPPKDTSWLPLNIEDDYRDYYFDLNSVTNDGLQIYATVKCIYAEPLTRNNRDFNYSYIRYKVDCSSGIYFKLETVYYYLDGTEEVIDELKMTEPANIQPGSVEEKLKLVICGN